MIKNFWKIYLFHEANLLQYRKVYFQRLIFQVVKKFFFHWTTFSILKKKFIFWQTDFSNLFALKFGSSKTRAVLLQRKKLPKIFCDFSLVFEQFRYENDWMELKRFWKHKLQHFSKKIFYFFDKKRCEVNALTFKGKQNFAKKCKNWFVF